MITENDILSIPGWFKLASNGKWANDVYASRRNKYWHVWFNSDKTKLRYHDGNIKEISFDNLPDFIRWANNQLTEIEIKLITKN